MIYNDSKTRSKNRKKIVEVTKSLFIEKGIAHTTVIDIVGKAEMERKTFYNYFNDKEEIADYIYFQSLNIFYSEGFGLKQYVDCTSGYKKVQRYLVTIVDHFVEYSSEMLLLVHYDYYFKNEATNEIVSEIYVKNNIQDPLVIFMEGINDNSINIGGNDPEEIFSIISQSIGAYASRLILRGYKNGGAKSGIVFDSLYKLLDIYLNSIKNHN